MKYEAQSGDTLSKIAKQHGLTLGQLLDANPRFKANPDKLAVGDVLEIPSSAGPGPSPIPLSPHVLGQLSEKFETGGRGPGTVSSGKGDKGGASYGSYQMTSAAGGTVKQFVSQADFPWRTDFAGLTPGTAAFTAKWKAIAAAEAEKFQAVQHQYIKRTHYDVLVDNVLDEGLDIGTRSMALQDVIWSTAVQHGPNTTVVHRALENVKARGLTPDSPGFDHELIKAIYAERGRRDVSGVLVHFAQNSAAVQKGVAERFVREEADALQMLEHQ
jgi:LysM repeat protein